MTPQEELRAKIARQREEAKAKEEAEAKSIAKIKEDSKQSRLAKVADMSVYAGLGMQNIDGEDIRPPRMFLVQNIKNKTELVDQNGRECPDGKYFLKGTNEILDSLSVNFVMIRKDHYQAKEGENPVWNGVRWYRAIAVRKDNMMPFIIDFKKSSCNALADLITLQQTEKMPVFIYNCELKTMIKRNKQGNDYFASVVTVQGKEEDPEKLNFLLEKAQLFGNRQDLVIDEEEVEENGNGGVRVEKTVEFKKRPTEEISSEDIPF